MAVSAVSPQRQAPPNGHEAPNPFPALEYRRRITLMQFWKVVSGLVLAMALWVLAALVLVWSAAPASTGISMVQVQSLWSDPDYPTWVWPLISLWLLSGALICSIAYRRCAQMPRDTFLARCQAEILDACSRRAFAGIGYSPHAAFSADTVDNAALFTQRCGRFDSSGAFEGHHRGVRVQLGAIAIAEPQAQKSGYGASMFAGALFAAEFAVRFPVTTRLLPRGAKCKTVKGEQRAAFEQQALAQRFDIRCTDPIRLKQRLGPHVLHALSELAEAYPGLRLRMAQRQLLLLLPGCFPVFQPSLYKPVVEQDQAAVFTAAVGALLTLTEALRTEDALS